MIAIPNMDMPKSCDECRILRAEFDGSYDKPITGCRQKMGEKSTLREEWDALILDCPLIDIVRCGECVKANTKDCSHSYWDDDWGEWRIGYKDDDWFCADGERRSK